MRSALSAFEKYYFERLRSEPPLIFAAACFFIACLPLFFIEYFPFIDYYNHIARYYILANYEQLDTIREYYIPNWRLLPNIGLDLIAVGLFRLVGAAAGAKALLFLIFLVQYSGALFLQYSMQRRLSLLTMGTLPLLFFSFVLNWGFANFLLGLGLCFWGLGAWLYFRANSPKTAIALSVFMSVTIFMTHGLAFFFYGVILFTIEFQEWFRTNRRQIKPLLARIGLISIQAVIPILLFLESPTAQVKGGITVAFANLSRHAEAGHLADRLIWEVSHRLEVVFRIIESPYKAFDMATIAFLMVLTGVSLRKGWISLDRRMLLPLVTIAGLYVITPPNLFGVGYIPERIPLLFAFILLTALNLKSVHPKSAVVLTVVTLVILVTRTAVLSYGLTGYSDTYRKFIEDAAEIPVGARVKVLSISRLDRRDEIKPTCSPLESLLVPTRQAVVPLFAFSYAQPLARSEKYMNELAKLPGFPANRFAPIGTFYDDFLASLISNTEYDYVVLCGQDNLVRSLPKALLPIAGETSPYRIYRVVR